MGEGCGRDFDCDWGSGWGEERGSGKERGVSRGKCREKERIGRGSRGEGEMELARVLGSTGGDGGG